MSKTPAEQLFENCKQLREVANEARELRHLYLQKAASHLADTYKSGQLPAFVNARESAAAGVSDPIPLLLDVDEQIALCRALLNENAGPEKREFPAALDVSLPSRVAFMASAFSDAALRQFERLVSTAERTSLSSGAEVCEEVASGRAQLGILPVEDAANGRLSHFHELIDRYELHISHTAEVEYPDGGQTVRYALLYKTAPPRAALRGEPMLECVFSDGDGVLLTSLLTAALACGLRLRRVDSFPLPYRNDTSLYRPVFYAGDAENALFSLYLSLFLPRVSVAERYIHLK